MEQLRQLVSSLFMPSEDDPNKDEDYPPWDRRVRSKVGTVEKAIAYVRPRLFPDASVNLRTSSITGAHIPPEIFPDILFFVSTDNQIKSIRQKVVQENWEYFLVRIALTIAQPAYTLKSCSLVSVYWANQCRRYIFLDHFIRLRNYRDAVAFRHYSTLPKSRLTPICDLVKVVKIYQVRPDSRSLLHIICLPSTQRKLQDFHIQGPISSRTPTPTLSTPHYSLPHRMAMPPSVTPYRAVFLTSLNFSSFHNVVSYIRNFRDAERLQFSSLTWNDAPSASPVEIVRSPFRRHARRRIYVEVYNCTNNYLLCYQTMVLFPDSLLRTIPDQDQRVIESITRGFYTHFTSLPDNGDVPSCTMRHDVPQVDQLRFYMSSVLKGYPGIGVEFICQQSSQPGSCRDSTPGPFRPTGLRISFRRAVAPASPEDAFITADLTVLRTQLADLCAIHTIVFAFHGYPIMRGVLDRHPALREPLAGKERYIFVCRGMRSERWNDASVEGPWNRNGQFRALDWVGVDPITLEANGMGWEGELDIVSELLREG
ncbi:hypothetical protein BDW22DRAFT_1349578 [Trametopsis cervina]|nr:hypothetical protein BDW22DRAFT_1349578 [Trametopsis cervina]